MTHFVKYFLFLACAVGLTIQSPYKAAVVEYAVDTTASNTDQIKTLLKNVDNYVKIITGADNEGTDIIVFPESTLNSLFQNNRSQILEHALYIPNPSENIVPCDNDKYSKVLQKLSCAAKSSKMYVVINISEKHFCSNENDQRQCAKDGHNLYNSNVVFDRTGRVVSRYRKTNLFGEIHFNTTAVPEVETFSTDFDVTFGHLICFDLMFNTPSMSLLNEKGVRNFIVSMMWFSELPFLTAIQYQEAWAYANNVNLLVAGANNPSSGSGGSGIYAGKHGARVAFYTGNSQTKVLKSVLNGDVSSSDNIDNMLIDIKSINPERMSFFRDNMDVYSWKLINLSTETEISENICYHDFCCKIFARISKQNNVSNYKDKYYMAVAFDGVRSFDGMATGGVQTCGVIACSGDTISTCGKRMITVENNGVAFEELIVTGNFRSENTSQFPVTLQNNLIPLRADNYIYLKKTNHGISNIKLHLTKQTSTLLTFAVFGRDFEKDGMPISTLNIKEKNTEDDFVYLLKIQNSTQNLHIDDATNVNGNNMIDDNEQTYWEYFSIRLQVCLFVIALYFLEMM